MPSWQNMVTTELMTNQIYKTDHGSFTIEKTRFMYKSVNADTGEDLVFGETPEAVWTVTPTHLEAHALGLKEEHSYAGTVGGKL